MSDFPETRNSLINALRTEDADSWMLFTATYEPVIYRVASRTGLQHADALDVTQEVLARVVRRISEWDSERSDGRFRNWLHRLTVNASIDVIRRRKRQVSASGDTAIHCLLAETPAPEDESTLFQLEYKRVIFNRVADRVRAEISSKAWEAFWLTSVQGVRAHEVANQLGLTVGAVYAHKCRVLARIRNQVQSISTETPIVIENFK